MKTPSGYPVSIRFGPWLVSLINVGGNWNCCTTSSTHWVNHGCCHTWSYMRKLDWWQKGSWGKNGDAHPARILPKNAHAAQAQAVRRHHQQERIRPGERWSGEPWIQPPETQPWPRDWPTTGDSITTCRWEPASKAPTTAPSTKRKAATATEGGGIPPTPLLFLRAVSKAMLSHMLLASQHSSGKSWYMQLWPEIPVMSTYYSPIYRMI